MTLYGRVQEVAVRDFEFLRLLSEGSLDMLVTKVTEHLKNYEGEDSKEGFIYQCIMEEVAHLTSKGLLLEMQLHSIAKKFKNKKKYLNKKS